MQKWKRAVLLLWVCLVCWGCSPNVAPAEPENPPPADGAIPPVEEFDEQSETSRPENYWPPDPLADYQLCKSNTLLALQANYPFVESFGVRILPNIIMAYVIIVAPDTTEEQGLQAAYAALQIFNDEVAAQNKDIAAAGPGYYGGLYDLMTVRMAVQPKVVTDWYIAHDFDLELGDIIEIKHVPQLPSD